MGWTGMISGSQWRSFTGISSLNTFKFCITFDISAQVKVFTVLAFSQRRIKNKVIFKIYNSGAVENVLTFNPGWLEGRVVVAQTTENRWGAFIYEDPKNPQTTIFKTIIIFFWNLVVCSGFWKYEHNCFKHN